MIRALVSRSSGVVALAGAALIVFSTVSVSYSGVASGDAIYFPYPPGLSTGLVLAALPALAGLVLLLARPGAWPGFVAVAIGTLTFLLQFPLLWIARLGLVQVPAGTVTAAHGFFLILIACVIVAAGGVVRLLATCREVPAPR